jgi:hypothetical protein
MTERHIIPTFTHFPIVGPGKRESGLSLILLPYILQKQFFQSRGQNYTSSPCSTHISSTRRNSVILSLLWPPAFRPNHTLALKLNHTSNLAVPCCHVCFAQLNYTTPLYLHYPLSLYKSEGTEALRKKRIEVDRGHCSEKLFWEGKWTANMKGRAKKNSELSIVT